MYRRVPLGRDPRAIVHTDATDAGRRGAVDIYSGIAISFQTHVPDWVEISSRIYQFKVAGALFGLLCAMGVVYGAPAKRLFDNHGARGIWTAGLPGRL